MNSELKAQLKRDLKISRYEGEMTTYYECRLIYSALSEWLRYAVFDETTDNTSCKSKAYILSRGIEVLNSFIGSSGELHQWFVEDERGVHELDEPVREIRNRMLLAGEYFELLPSHDLTVPSTERVGLNEFYDRVIGIPEENQASKVKYVGVTKVAKALEAKELCGDFTIEQYMEWILNKANWNSINDIEKFEFFDARSIKAPYKSWIDFPVKDMNYHLARISLYNGIHEYYLFKKDKDGKWLNAQLEDMLSEAKEERRILLGMRMMCNNKAIAKYRLKNDIVELKLFCRLPIKEEVFIETFSWPLRYYMDKLNYIVPIEVWPNVKYMLEVNLGLKIEEQ